MKIQTAAILFLFALFLTGCAPSSLSRYQPDKDSVQVLSTEASTAMVVSAHPIASAIGLKTLQGGGNATDAAIATLSALNVVEPHASGLGGGGFALYYCAAKDSFFVIDYRERAPAEVIREQYYRKEDSLHTVRSHGATAIGTPGAPAGWQMLFDNFGTQPLPSLVAPAAQVADAGFPLSEKQVAIIMDHLQDIASDSAIASIFFDNGLPPEPGFVVKQPQLAATLRTLGKSAFTQLYTSPFAEDFVHTVQARGGSLTERDLSSYRARSRQPLRGRYHEYEIITLPPPSIGGTALLEILKFAEQSDLRSKQFLSTEYVHTLAQASRQALRDVTTWISDPDYDQQPVSSLLSNEWIDRALQRMNEEGVPEQIPSWNPGKTGNTTHLVIVDSLGNLLSLTQSINDFYGAGVMAPTSGIMLNNHMADFSADSTRKNSVQPNHRPVSNMASTIVLKNGKPVLVIGSPGGPRIAPTVAQVIIAVLDGRLSLRDAVRMPRFFPQNSVLWIESRMPEETVEGLKAKGWKVLMNGSTNAYFGGVHAIAIDSVSHRLTGVADPRRDGAPAGWEKTK